MLNNDQSALVTVMVMPVMIKHSHNSLFIFYFYLSFFDVFVTVSLNIKSALEHEKFQHII